MSKVTQAHIDARRESIRDAAVRLFVRKGIEGARMEEIAADLLQEGDIDVELAAALLAHLVVGGVQFMAAWWVADGGSGLTREQVVEATMGLYWLGFERLDRGERWNR